MKQTVLAGADRIDEYASLFEGKKLGLLTNPTGILKEGTPTANYLAERFDLRALFAPEHGLAGAVQAGGEIGKDESGTVPVYTMFGDRTEAYAAIDGLDLLVCDIQDVGCRYYTYVGTMSEMMEQCEKKGVPFLVLDRINPIGGAIEGVILEDGISTLVGKYPVPHRHGLTMGEMAKWIAMRFLPALSLTVVPCSGWTRNTYFDETDLPFVIPSPNMPTVETAFVYPGTCLFEATNLSEGRGTTKPFELFGSPWLRTAELDRAFREAALPGSFLRETGFTPTFSKYQGEYCRGFQLHITDRNTFLPVKTGLVLLSLIRRQNPECTVRDWGLTRLTGTKSVVDPAFDLLKWLEDGKAGVDAYKNEIRPLLLYGEEAES